MMAWVDALRHYAEHKGGKWKIPKKGTKEYDEVKSYQAKGYLVEGEEVEKAHVPKKRGRPSKAKAVAEAPAVEKKMSRKVVMDKKGGMKVTLKERKVRSDKGKKRGPSVRRIAEESVKQKLVTKTEAFGRKQRKDKGVKRGARGKKNMPPAVGTEEEVFYYQ